MLVVGDREAAEGTVSVRTRTGGDQGAADDCRVHRRRRARKSPAADGIVADRRARPAHPRNQ